MLVTSDLFVPKPGNGAGYQRNRKHLVRYHQNALARLGVEVIVTPSGDGAPPPPTPHNRGQAA